VLPNPPEDQGSNLLIVDHNQLHVAKSGLGSRVPERQKVGAELRPYMTNRTSESDNQFGSQAGKSNVDGDESLKFQYRDRRGAGDPALRSKGKQMQV